MITISNSQRDYIVKYIDTMCESLTGTDNKTFNTIRMARNLQNELKEKQPLTAEDMPHLCKLICK